MFTYQLPSHRIAQRPIGMGEARAESKLLRARISGRGLLIEDQKFSDIASVLRPDDLLILNNSRVVPSRFFSTHVRTGRELEMLLVHKLGQSEGIEKWKALGQPLKILQEGDVLLLSESLSARVGPRTLDRRGIELTIEKRTVDAQAKSVHELIEEEAIMPIPPYIREGRADEEDRLTYQTVYGEISGSIAAPTAGLHFTPRLLQGLKDKGVTVQFVTLHVGVASFQPIDTEEAEKFRPAKEQYAVPEATVRAIQKQQNCGKRIVAVGTTVVRALESWFRSGALVDSRLSETDLFIVPGFSFSVVDALITNFHQPRSTHLQLVSAFFGSDSVKQIYQYALDREYRFLSYGDAMFLEK